MIPLSFANESHKPRRVLFVGAHSDDIEIGCGGTIIRLLESDPDIEIRWIVLSGNDEREREARCAASLFLAGCSHADVTVLRFRDGFFPYTSEIKDFFETLKSEPRPDLIFTHSREDRHQDHRVVSELTWNTFRNHAVLEYEIPKYDGGLTTPNLYVPIDDETRARKVEYLMRAFGSQRSRAWFTDETFTGLMRLRGVESGLTEPFAEGFFAKKLVLGL